MPTGLRATPAAVLVACLTVACGSPLEDPIDNIAACRQIYLAIRDKTCTDDQFRWLNCDRVPGCPSGQVDRSDIDDCVARMRAAPDCASALLIQCDIAKAGCASPAPEFADPIGFDAACDLLRPNLEAAGCVIDETVCSEVLGCDLGGAYDTASVEAAHALAAGAASCDDARAAIRAAEIEKKYCFQVN